ncbi:CoA-binding protein [Dehalococcoidia bacterium]|nr:CoA-binding protein [Dehalococcoidia bacterium]
MSVDFAALDRVFNPKTVVVIGDKKASGYMWLKANKDFKGNLYSVQIDPNEIQGIEELGVKNFTSLKEVPAPIDYAIVAVPRVVAARIVADCIENKVGGATLFTSGFAETGTDEGIESQNRLLDMAKEAGLVLIGPNCMGLYNPGLGLSFSLGLEKHEGGNVAFSSQSGSLAIAISQAAPHHGIRISRAVSFGNGIVLENADYLQYLAQDPGNEIIGMYIEGLRNGRRFFEILRDAAAKKPVVIWKGGQTEAGQRATSSHTASLAESMTIWRSIARQTGTILTDSLDETLDAIKCLLYLPPFTGMNCGLTGGAGGQSVTITDAFAKAGMSVPNLSTSSYNKLAEFFSLVGASFRNPIDMGSNRTEIDTILDILNNDSVIDVIVMQMSVASGRNRSGAEAQIDALTKFKERSSKPVIAIPYSMTPHEEAEALKSFESRLFAAGIPSFPTYERAAKALKHVRDYHQFHSTG